jgi:hypothetical protein
MSESDYDPITGHFVPMRIQCRRKRKQHSVEIPFDDSFLNLPDPVYEPGKTLEEKLAELEGSDSD